MQRQGRAVLPFQPRPRAGLVEACASKGDALRRERAIKALSKRAKERLLVGVPVLREVGEPAIQDVHLRSWGIRGLPEESLVETLDPPPRLQAAGGPASVGKRTTLVLEEQVELGHLRIVPPRLEIGAYSCVRSGTDLSLVASIGRFCSIGSDCFIGQENTPIPATG